MSESLPERYAAIERLYSQGEWQQVLEASGALLNEIPQQPGEPLRARLSLLQGHTLFYGLGRASEAALIYRQVLDAEPEPVLLNIAQQELQRCLAQATAQPADQPPLEPEPVAAMSDMPAAAAGSAFPFVAQAVGGAAAGQSPAAMPWMEALGGVDPAATPQASELNGNQAPWLSQSAEVPAAPLAETATTVAAMPTTDVTAPGIEAETAAAASSPVSETTPTAASEVLAPVISADVVHQIEAPPVVDVIDEPDQLEVHQADPERAQVLDVDPVAQVTIAPASEPFQADRWSSAEAAELAKGLLTVELR